MTINIYIRDGSEGGKPAGSPEAKAAIARVRARLIDSKWTAETMMSAPYRAPKEGKTAKPLTRRCLLCEKPIARNRKRCQPCAAKHERDRKNELRRKAQ